VLHTKSKKLKTWHQMNLSIDQLKILCHVVVNKKDNRICLDGFNPASFLYIVWEKHQAKLSATPKIVTVLLQP